MLISIQFIISSIYRLDYDLVLNVIVLKEVLFYYDYVNMYNGYYKKYLNIYYYVRIGWFVLGL